VSTQRSIWNPRFRFVVWISSWRHRPAVDGVGFPKIREIARQTKRHWRPINCGKNDAGRENLLSAVAAAESLVYPKAPD